MIILIAGASHTGKTAFAQGLIEKLKYPCLSIDHLKMGLIRSGCTDLTPLSDDGELTDYLWPVVREMIKTAIENNQNMIIEGCYIPFDWQKDFTAAYLERIKYCCLILSEAYIEKHFDDIKGYADVIEKRICDEDLTPGKVKQENMQMLDLAKKHKVDYLLIEDNYKNKIEEKIKEFEIGTGAGE